MSITRRNTAAYVSIARGHGDPVRSNLSRTGRRPSPVTPSVPHAWIGGRKAVPMSLDRQWLVDTPRRLGYAPAADEAARVLPEQVSMEEIRKFADRYGISRDEVISRMG